MPYSMAGRAYQLMNRPIRSPQYIMHPTVPNLTVQKPKYKDPNWSPPQADTRVFPYNWNKLLNIAGHYYYIEYF